MGQHKFAKTSQQDHFWQFLDRFTHPNFQRIAPKIISKKGLASWAPEAGLGRKQGWLLQQDPQNVKEMHGVSVALCERAHAHFSVCMRVCVGGEGGVGGCCVCVCAAICMASLDPHRF